MRIKVDFVTNSSSASFTIPKRNINIIQKVLLFHHLNVFYAYMAAKFKKKHGYIPSSGDEWIIIERSTTIYGATTMDNFDMALFFKEIGLPDCVKSHDYSVYDYDFPNNRKLFKKLKEKYSLDKLENNNPCKKCLVGVTCTKDISKKTACKKYIYFIKRMVKEAKKHEKKRVYYN